MMLKAFSLYDTKTGTYATPFFMRHAGEALRAVTDLAQDLNTTVGRHPSDFALMQIGEFDDSTGLFQPQQPASLGMVVSFLPAPAAAPLFDGGDPTTAKPVRLDGIQPNGKFIERS